MCFVILIGSSWPSQKINLGPRKRLSNFFLRWKSRKAITGVTRTEYTSRGYSLRYTSSQSQAWWTNWGAEWNCAVIRWLIHIKRFMFSQHLSSIYQSFDLSIFQSINRSISPSINLSIHRSIFQSINHSVNLSINQYVNKSIYQSINQSIYQSIYQSINLSIHLSMYQSINQSINL